MIYLSFRCLAGDQRRLPLSNHQRLRVSLGTGCVAERATSWAATDVHRQLGRAQIHLTADGAPLPAGGPDTGSVQRPTTRADPLSQLRNLVDYIDRQWMNNPVGR